MTGKSSIRLALAVVAALALGISLLTLSYLNGMVDQIQQIGTVDTRIAQLGETLSIRILEARRDEKNFIITLDSTYIESNRRILREMNDATTQAYTYAKGYNVELDSLLTLLADYGKGITALFRTLRDDPRTLNRLQRQLKAYEDEIRRLEQRGKIPQESLNQLAQDANLSAEAAQSAISNEKAQLFMELKDGANAILALTQSITDKARAALTRHAGAGVQQGIKAQRNTLTFLFVAVLMVIYLVVVFPHRLFQPMQRLERTLQAVERGDESAQFPALGADEFGTLGRHIEKALSRLRLYNQMKSTKITDGQRQLQRILDTLDESVLILSADLNILYINKAGKNFWETGSPLTGQSVRNLPALWDVAGPTFEDIRRQGRTELSVRFNRRNLTKRKLVIFPHITQNDVIETIVVMVK